jgi:NAD(P)H-flavin reductase
MNGDSPRDAVVVERIEETDDIFTLRLAFSDQEGFEVFRFQPGQFNMVYLHGVGEVPISIVSDPEDPHYFDHTIRSVGRVTEGLFALRQGDHVGIRGPFGRGWPLAQAEGRDLLIVTGGLGCAPVVALINYVMRRRQHFGRVTIMQGVRHSHDLIWRERYDAWAQQPDTEVLLAADSSGGDHHFYEGPVIELFSKTGLDPQHGIALLCGPERMMLAAIQQLQQRGFSDESLWLSMERNMQCGNGQCGHCQFGPLFICKDGPVFCYSEIKDHFGVKGF